VGLLADKLKSLGVKMPSDSLGQMVRASDLPAPAPKEGTAAPIETVLDGHWIETRRGEAFISDQFWPLEYSHGQVGLFSSAPLHNLAHWAGDARLHDLPIEKIAFLDTETSGLAGGTGTYAFLVGIGRFSSTDSIAESRIRTESSTDSFTDSRIRTDGKAGFQLRQFFMRDPSEEAALLEAMLDFMAPCEALVTFNGKAFDAPLLTTRYTLHSIPTPFRNFTHVDLLPLARRLWRDRLPSRALKYLEEHVMFAPRTSEEVPGYEIPFLYFDFLRTGDAAPLKGVFYHNAMDIVAMTALFSHTASMLADPHSADLEHGLDVAALAKLFEDMGKWDDAARLYERGLQIGLPEAGFAETLRRYSALQRRRGNVESAVKLWEQAAGEGHVYAHVELSKHHEHRKRDISEAFRWARSALELAQAPSLPPSIRKYWTEEITHRLARLEKKFNSPKESYP
jgi:uncharacterized protein YprB with RNaseH-like and TPR domain